MRWRRFTHRLPLTGVAVAGAVVGHMVAYVLAVPSRRSGWPYSGPPATPTGPRPSPPPACSAWPRWPRPLRRRFRAGLLSGPPQPGERLGRLAGQLTGFQIAIYLVQETLERLEAGIPAHALVDGRLLVIGVAVQGAVAVALLAGPASAHEEKKVGRYPSWSASATSRRMPARRTASS